MSASVSRIRIPAFVLALALAGCGPAPTYRYGFNAAALLFSPTSPTEGIHPDASVVRDPDNPFRVHPLGPKTKWALLDGGVSVAAFYAFATSLVAEPIGENQFYAAKALEEIAATSAVKDVARVDEVKRMAIAGYQALLDQFPDALGYDATGTTGYRLATPAYKAIVALGGTVKGDWVLVKTQAGEEAVRASALPAAK